ncbi:hypothetical protein ACVIIV_005323 [Bradyrhizobium sp. USDA 4354]
MSTDDSIKEYDAFNQIGLWLPMLVSGKGSISVEKDRFSI